MGKLWTNGICAGIPLTIPAESGRIRIFEADKLLFLNRLPKNQPSVRCKHNFFPLVDNFVDQWLIVGAEGYPQVHHPLQIYS